MTAQIALYDSSAIPDRPSPLPALNSSESSVVSARSGSLRELLSFAFPLIISHMSQSMMWVVDTLIMGYVGTVEQGAVGLGGVLSWALVSFFMGTVSVVNVFVAQDFGANRSDLARHVRSAAVLALPMSVVIGALWFVVPSGLHLLGATSDVRPHAQTYIQIRLLSAPLVLLSFAITSFLRGVGDVITPMVVSICANIVNAAAACVLVFGLFGLHPMGVAGAAWGFTFAATFESACYVLVFLFSKRAKKQGSRCFSLPRFHELRAFVRDGTPIGLSWFFEMAAWTSFSVYAGTRLPHELAAHTIIIQLLGFCFMPAMAISIAASTLVGQYIGAKRSDIASRTARRAVLAAMVYTSIVGGALALFRVQIVSAFNPAPAVIATGATIAILAAIYQPFDGLGIVGQGILRGAGHTSSPTYVMLASGLLVFIPLVYVLGHLANLGIVGAWIAANAHVLTVAGIFSVVLARGKWRTGRLLNEQNPSA